MVASPESERSRTPNKEVTTDQQGYDCELTQPKNAKILQRATLKIDFYLIPIVGMFCLSYPLTSTSSCLSHLLDFLSFLVSPPAIAPFNVPTTAKYF